MSDQPGPHLDLDALADALDPPDGTAADAAHLAGCADCRGRRAELAEGVAAVRAALRALPEPALPADLAARLDAALAGTPGPAGDPVPDPAGEPVPDPAGDPVPDPAGDPVPDPAGEPVPASAAVTTLPVGSERRARPRVPRWLAAAAAAVVVLGGGGLALRLLRTPPSAPAVTAQDAGRGVDGFAVVRNDTGTDYRDQAALAAAVPDLLAGRPPEVSALTAPQDAAAPRPAGGATGGGAGSTGGGPAALPEGGPAARSGQDPLARLRTDAGLADCLLALLPPDDPDARPLALDFAAFAGRPALIVILPGARPGRLDVFAVGPQCSQADDGTLFYTSVPAP